MPFLSHNHSPICFIARWGIGFTSCITNKEGASWTYDTLSVIDKIFSKTNHMQISFCFPASYFLLSCCLHAAGNAERSGYCGENADSNLNHHFPSILLHRLLSFRNLRCRRRRLHLRYCRRWYPGHQWFRYRQLPAFHCLQFR